jgi:hypothetical protein
MTIWLTRGTVAQVVVFSPRRQENFPLAMQILFNALDRETVAESIKTL